MSGAEEGGAAAGRGGEGRVTEDLHGVKAIPKIMDVDCVDHIGDHDPMTLGKSKKKEIIKESGREIMQSAIDGNSEFMESDDDANIEEDLVVLMETNLNSVLLQREIFWKQRSKQLWLREGDSNSKYFHASATSRRRRNSIQKLKDSDGVWVDWKGRLPSVMNQSGPPTTNGCGNSNSSRGRGRGSYGGRSTNGGGRGYSNAIDPSVNFVVELVTRFRNVIEVFRTGHIIFLTCLLQALQHAR
ncbi:hypothetical protein F8388_020524 [Cannabis sativa]|uniref:Uncharacterized protein n=1 Tax=Cannabis sativa TaxID=3483 RepID=A0A7J6EXC0_CANSA|nr:hypothetical protein F8388_020524 [Cannabis sativa]